MDHQRDSVWIEPLEATALSDDEEADTQTPVSLEDDMNRTGPGTIFDAISAGGDAGASSREEEGVGRLPFRIREV